MLSYGAVSEEVARSMAEGAIKNADADMALAVTGNCRPGRRQPNKTGGYSAYSIVLQGNNLSQKV